MTRINAYIKPIQLTDAHLLAEIKEINQLCGQYQKSKSSGFGIFGIPKHFKLNTGHVKFFYNKGYYLSKRFYELRHEAINRGFNVTADFNKDVWEEKHFKDWNPCTTEQTRIRFLLIERITERLLNQKLEPRYYGYTITRSGAVELFNYKNN